MREILYRYKKYDIEYNRGLGIITLNKEIPVSDFLELKKLLRGSGQRIADIRVYGEKIYKVRSWLK